ncbi:MAG TPA: beta-ketoacyl synthase N-terminal-like domain-containing protein [Solirubrobacteraceae bacterium]|nr:beta-ketoacyl synthase N-terminal-like domain-containing protein [Solirubrobacteraceae bacterium]
MTSAYVYEAVRTPFGRYGGALAGVRPDDLAAHSLRALLGRVPGLEPEDVLLGNANGAGEENRDVARMAVLLAGLPTSVPGVTVNRLCGSSLDAAIQAARAIECGDASVLVAGGAELNQAFASQSLACLAGWPDLDPEKVNVRGGAIAIGHLLGASGARILGRHAHELRARGGGYGVAALCIGVGQGLAVVLQG